MKTLTTVTLCRTGSKGSSLVRDLLEALSKMLYPRLCSMQEDGGGGGGGGGGGKCPD